VIISCLQGILASSLCDDGHVSSVESLNQYYFAGPDDLDSQATDSLQHYLEIPENSTYTLQPMSNVQQLDQSFIDYLDLDLILNDILNNSNTSNLNASEIDFENFENDRSAKNSQLTENPTFYTVQPEPIGDVQQFNQSFINPTDMTQPIGNFQQFNESFINEVGVNQGQAVEGLSVYSVWEINSPGAAAKPTTCQPKEKTKNAQRLEKCRLKKKKEDMNIVSTFFRLFQALESGKDHKPFKAQLLNIPSFKKKWNAYLECYTSQQSGHLS